MTPPEVAADPTLSRMDQAYDFCIEQISEQLKAPATAKFSDRDPDSEAPDGDRLFLFAGTVDSDNSFGAFVRSEWACEIAWSPSAGFTAEVAAVD